MVYGREMRFDMICLLLPAVSDIQLNLSSRKSREGNILEDEFGALLLADVGLGDEGSFFAHGYVDDLIVIVYLLMIFDLASSQFMNE